MEKDDPHKQKTLTFRFLPGEQDRLTRYAKRVKKSLAQVVHAAIEAFLDAKEK